MVLFSNLLFGDGTDIRISIGDASSVYEHDETMSFTIQLTETPDWGEEVVVNYSTHNNTAEAGEDYDATSGSVTFYGASLFPPRLGDTTKTITVTIVDDTIHESSENFYVKITNNTEGYIVSDDKGYGTIYDDDALPIEARIHDRWEDERDNNWILNFTVRLNQNAPEDITLNYTTQNSSAIAGDDYIASSGTVTIPTGSTDGYIPITIIGDTTPEDRENFKVKINSISRGTITRDTATGTIVDDDAIEVDITSDSVNEGDIGDHNSMQFKIFLTKEYPLDTPLTINYTTQDGSSPSATEGSDYDKTTGSVTFNKGEKEKIIDVPIIGDNIIEPDENLKMVISGSSYIINSSSQSKIINDDGSYPSVDFATGDFSIIEGNSSTKTLNFHFELNKDALADTYFYYYTQDDEATIADNDYVKIEKKKYIIPVGTRDIDIAVTINGDTKIENDERFYLKIVDEYHLNVATHRAEGIILNDDGDYPTLSFTQNSFSIYEGDSGQRDLNFTLTLDAPAFENSHFDYRTSNSSAKEPEDYIKIPRTTYNIHEGEQNITISVKINGDTDIEGNERFYLKIDNESENLKITGTQKSKGIILNDDGSYPTITIDSSSYSVVEGNSSTKNLKIRLELNSPALMDSSIKYYTKDNTAQDGDKSTEDRDYTKTTGKLSIEENATTAFVEIPILGDTLIEPDEKFKFYIHSPQNLIIRRSKTTVNIINDDIHSNDPFECNKYMYISSSKKRGSSETGRMWLHRVDTTQNPFSFEVMDDEGEERLYNAIAYNPNDNYIYGLYFKNLIKLTKSGNVIDLGEIAGLPDRFSTKQLFAGAINSGHYYVTGRNSKQKYLYKIKLSDMSVEEMNLTQEVAIQDFSFYHEDNATKYLYGVDKNGKLTKIDSITGEVTFIGSDHLGYKFDSSFSDKSGRFFANDSNGNGFFEFNLATGEKSFISSSQPATFNDGANCINASLVFTDYGDAPLSYGKTWHNIANGIYLGDEVDHDIEDYDTVDADGDDKNGVDDDDGVTLLDGTDINGTNFETNTTHQLKVKLSKEAYLKIWIDKDINGHFDNSSDLIYNSSGKLSAGEHNITFALPFNLQENKKTYLRARVSSSSSMNPTGFVTDGEVEDYLIYFGKGIQPLRGRFNIQRTNSLFNAKDFALYTQIVGRDFDYHIVFYDENLTAEKELEKVPLKIDLIDYDSKAVLYTGYYYFSHHNPSSRVVVIDSDDLDKIPATKKALFQITYATTANGAIAQQECGADYESCFNSLISANDFNRTDDAKDMFAIRPDSFYITIADGNSTKVNSGIEDNLLRMASGYDYNLTIKATKYLSTAPAIGYTKIVNAQFDFNSTGGVDTSPINKTISFVDGFFTDMNFTHNNVGKYILEIPNDSSWTELDQNKTTSDCIQGSGERVANEQGLIGCDILTNRYPIEMLFMPHHFDINLSINNLPQSGHSDFIYMSELNSTNANTAIVIEGKIVPMSRDNSITTNFTIGCVAQDTNLSIDTNTITDGAFNSNFIRAIKYNSDINFTIDQNSILDNLTQIDIAKERFLDENNGSVPLDIRFNIDKNQTTPTNPIEITFNRLDINSSNAYSVAEGIEPYIPTGTKNINKTVNFYFARVVSDLNNYPRVNITISPIVKTPLNVDIFCNTIIVDYCKDRGVLDNTNLLGTTREQNGWYLSINHNGELDGNVTKLEDNPNIITIRDDLIEAEDKNVTLNNGENNLIDARVDDCISAKSTTVTITTTPELRFPSQYIINCTDKNASQWTGVGKTGNILNIKPKVGKVGKMDW